MNLIDEIKNALRVGTPLIGVTTADQPNTIAIIREGLPKRPLILWDVVRGYSPMNKAGAEAIAALQVDPEVTTNFVEALKLADRFPESAAVVLCSANRFIQEDAPMQAVLNLRDPFKGTRRAVIMLGPDIRLPAELTQDVLMLDEELPDDSAIRAILEPLYSENGVKVKPEQIERSTDALRGLAAFPIESAAALSVVLSEEGKPVRADVDVMWQRKRTTIAQVRGLAMEIGGRTFEDMGGLDSAKEFDAGLFGGPNPPVAIVFVDELDKAVAGAGFGQGGGDSSGTSQDALQVLLTEIQDREYPGRTFIGPAGSGKTAYARALAATYKRPLLRLDLGAAKGSLVGQSEAQIRAALKAIRSIAGDGGALFIGTCNRIESIPPELRRRFGSLGIWFFDLPDAAERASIATIHAKRRGLKAADVIAVCGDGWSGANIAALCDVAYRLGKSPADVKRYVVPAARQDPMGLQKLRELAADKYLSASYPGEYKLPGGEMEIAQPRIRQIGIIAEVEEAPATPTKTEKARGN